MKNEDSCHGLGFESSVDDQAIVIAVFCFSENPGVFALSWGLQEFSTAHSLFVLSSFLSYHTISAMRVSGGLSR